MVVVDGFVAGFWSWTRHEGSASVIITTLDNLGPPQRDALGAEGDRLLGFLAPDAADREVRFDP
jgi:hypothetical protein